MKKSEQDALSIDQKNARKRHAEVGQIERELQKPKRAAPRRAHTKDPRQLDLLGAGSDAE